MVAIVPSAVVLQASVLFGNEYVVDGARCPSSSLNQVTRSDFGYLSGLRCLSDLWSCLCPSSRSDVVEYDDCAQGEVTK